MEHPQEPDLAEQIAQYREAFDALAGRPLVAHTLDVGGDKPLAYWPMPHEDNPFLGLRGIRLTLTRPEVMETQIRALLTAGPRGGQVELSPAQRVISRTACPSSGRISAFSASFTACGEPGIAKTIIPRYVPAVARDSIAALPISSNESMRKSSPNPGSGREMHAVTAS
jgi:hypothetical protein